MIRIDWISPLIKWTFLQKKKRHRGSAFHCENGKSDIDRTYCVDMARKSAAKRKSSKTNKNPIKYIISHPPVISRTKRKRIESETHRIPTNGRYSRNRWEILRLNGLFFFYYFEWCEESIGLHRRFLFLIFILKVLFLDCKLFLEVTASRSIDMILNVFGTVRGKKKTVKKMSKNGEIVRQWDFLRS